MPNNLSWFTSALVGMATISVVCGCNRSSSRDLARAAPPAHVQLVHLKRGVVTRSITLPGEVRAYQQATLYAKVPGYLKKMPVDKGDRVKEGDLLAEIEVPEMIADLAKYKVEVEVAEIDYKRLSESQKKAPDLVVPQTVDEARGRSDIAKANLERTQTLLNYAKITAPFSGVITRRWVDPGAFIPAATSSSAAQSAALLTLADFSTVRVQVAIPEPEVPFITNGLRADVTFQELAGRTFHGSVTRYAHALDEATKTMLTEIEIPNPKGDLRPGMYATVILELERKEDALTIPSECLLLEKSRISVFIVAAGKAQKIPVKVGFNDGISAEMLDGMKPNAPVILLGRQSVTDGQTVAVVEGK